MKVAVVGGNGQLGRDLCREYAENGWSVAPLGHDAIEVADLASCRTALAPLGPDLVVNTAAMHNVEACEHDPDRAFAVNALGARNLAMLARELGFAVAQISTDYVFDGAKGEPYVEADLPRPLNTYGMTKLAGEHYVQAHASRFFVVRTSALYGTSPCRAKAGLNFVQLMLKLARERGEVSVVTDEVVSPTYAADLAQQIVALTSTDSYGVFHATNQGACSWYEFAAEIFEQSGTPVKLRPARSGDFPKKTPRPGYSVLENHALKQLGIDGMPDWRESLRRYLEALHGATV